MAASIPTRTACALIRRSRATHYRHQQPPILGPRKPRTIPDNGQALTAAERAHVLTVINSDKYSDLAICQIYARELDDGNYWCSTSSMYRIASEAGQNRERRRLATHPAKVKPELLADGPSQVWTWDITKLRGPTKGVWFHLYVLIDIYSDTTRPGSSRSTKVPNWQNNSSLRQLNATAPLRTPSTLIEACR